MQKGNDALATFQIYGSDFLVRLELRVALFEKGLELVDLKDLLGRVCLRIKIGGQREHSVGGLGALYCLRVDAEGGVVNVPSLDIAAAPFLRPASPPVFAVVFSCLIDVTPHKLFALGLVEVYWRCFAGLPGEYSGYSG